jgi:hypothetical protein
MALAYKKIDLYKLISEKGLEPLRLKNQRSLSSSCLPIPALGFYIHFIN